MRILAGVRVPTIAALVFTSLHMGAVPTVLEQSGNTDVERDLRRFYEAVGQPTVWVDATGNPTDAARKAIRSLEAAAGEGLEPAEYRARELDIQATTLEHAQMPRPADIAAFDAQLTESLLRHFRHLHLGRVDPRAAGFDFDHRLQPHDFAEVLRQALSEGSVDRIVAGLRPEYGQYESLRNALKQYRHRADPQARRIELALERLRWIPHWDGERLVIVNIPTFHVAAWNATRPRGDPALEMAAIVGRTQTKTPMFTAVLSAIVFNPFWNVPDSILRAEILPAVERDPAYLQKHHMELTGTGDTPRVRQLPGPWNALGPIKFELPNRYDVYLHGTPERELFKRSRRAFSHGCVRVEDPVRLAEWLLSAENNWTRDRITAAIESGATSVVPLAQHARVLMFYLTAEVSSADGSIHFADDVYGHDARLATLLRVRNRENR